MSIIKIYTKYIGTVFAREFQSFVYYREEVSNGLFNVGMQIAVFFFIYEWPFLLQFFPFQERDYYDRLYEEQLHPMNINVHGIFFFFGYSKHLHMILPVV